MKNMTGEEIHKTQKRLNFLYPIYRSVSLDLDRVDNKFLQYMCRLKMM